MIIDIHSHIKLDGQQPLFQDMDKNGIDYRIVSCLSEPDTKIANKFVEELVSVSCFTCIVRPYGNLILAGVELQSDGYADGGFSCLHLLENNKRIRIYCLNFSF